MSFCQCLAFHQRKVQVFSEKPNPVYSQEHAIIVGTYSAYFSLDKRDFNFTPPTPHYLLFF